MNDKARAMIGTWTPGRTAAATLAIMLVVAAYFLLYRYRLVFFSLFEAIVFGTALAPAVEWLHRRKLPRVLAVALIFLAILGFIAFFVALFVPLVGEQGAAMMSTLQTYYQDLAQNLSLSPSLLVRRLALRLPSTFSIGLPSGAPETDAPIDAVTRAITLGGSIAKGAFSTIAVLLLTAYWTIDRERVLRWFFFLFPVDRRDSARKFYSDTEAKVGQYIRGLGVLCLIIGVAQFLAYTLIGLPNALLLAIIAGLMEAVPLIGSTVGAVPAVLVALSFKPEAVIWVIVATVVIQFLESNLLAPRVMKQAVGINPIVSLLAFFAFSSLFGLAGALLAIPLAVVLQLVFSRLLFEPNQVSQPQPVGRDSVSRLRYEAQELVQDIRKQVREKDGMMDHGTDRVEDAIEAVINDLDSILAQEEQTAGAAGQEATPA